MVASDWSRKETSDQWRSAVCPDWSDLLGEMASYYRTLNILGWGHIGLQDNSFSSHKCN